MFSIKYINHDQVMEYYDTLSAHMPAKDGLAQHNVVISVRCSPVDDTMA